MQFLYKNKRHEIIMPKLNINEMKLVFVFFFSCVSIVYFLNDLAGFCNRQYIFSIFFYCSFIGNYFFFNCHFFFNSIFQLPYFLQPLLHW